MLIGGGEIGKGETSYETVNIDQEIVRMSGVSHPHFLFIGFANDYAESYYEIIKKNFKKLGCTTSFLKKKNCLHNPELVVEKINQADIIYLGGGDTLKLLETLKEFGIDYLLQEAFNRGCVLAGISAGAIALCMDGFSDSFILRGESNRHEFVRGLQFVPIHISPHFHASERKTVELENAICEGKFEVYGIENCSAIQILDDYMNIIRESDQNNVYLCYYDQKYREKKL